MGDRLVAFIGAKTDESNSTVEDFGGDLIEQMNPNLFVNMRTINPHDEEGLTGPITTAVVADALTDSPSAVLSEQYQKRKPIFVKANINKTHLREGGNVDSDLRNIIKNRGITSWQSSDDCGRIIPSSLNGSNVDYNLFPQQMNINRGIFGNYVFWKAIEATIKLWLTLIPENLSPRVEYNILLSYTNSEKTDRPEAFKYVIRFYANNVSGGDTEEQLFRACNEILFIAKQAIKNRGSISIKSELTDIIRRLNLHEDQKIVQLVDELADVFRQARARPVTFHDFLPIYGGCTTVQNGIEDLKDGKILTGIGNTAFGVASVVADYASFGSLGMISGIGKIAVTGTAKTALTGAHCAKTLINCVRLKTQM